VMRVFFWASAACILFSCAQTPRQAPGPTAARTAPSPAMVNTAPANPEAPSQTQHASTHYAFQPVSQLLAAKCAPCHIPGGKMYARLPWDNPDVVRDHAEGIARRLKSPEDLQVLQQWLSSEKAPMRN
jgi:hypothetical protein